MSALLARYSAVLKAAPLRTNLATAVPLMVVGDLGAQQLEHRRYGRRAGPIDVQRTIVMSSYSGTIFTPIFYYLYKVMDRLLVGPPVMLALQKAVGSVVVGGIPANAAFLALATTVEMNVFGKVPASGASLTEVVSNKWQHDLPRVGAFPLHCVPLDMGPGVREGAQLRVCVGVATVLGSMSFWCPINFCNFYWTPPQYRILTVSVSAVFWNCYLSIVQHEYVNPEVEQIAADVGSRA